VKPVFDPQRTKPHEDSEAVVLTDNYGVEHSSESALLGMLVVLAAKARLIVGGILAAVVLTAVVVCIVPSTYTATTVILTPQSVPSSAAALLGELGGGGSLGSLASLASDGQFRSPSDTFLGVLGSRTVADDLIQRFDLRHVYRTRTMVDTRKALAKHTKVEVTRGYLIRISVEDHDVQRAVALANGYVEALYRVNQKLALTTGSQRRLFLEQQVKTERSALEQAEDAFRQIQQKTGVIQLAGQSELTLRSIAQIRANISAKEVQIQMLRATATEQNPELQRLEIEAGALRDQLAKAESSSPSDDNYFVSVGRIPQAGLEYVRKARDLRYHEALFEALAREYEAARQEEAKSPPVIQIVDPAIAPDKRSWPPRTLLVLLAVLVSCTVFVSAVLLHHRWISLLHSPQNAPHVLALREMLRAMPGAHRSTWTRARYRPRDAS
jgi:tyrosine-protein kinase Etk/Wzc